MIENISARHFAGTFLALILAVATMACGDDPEQPAAPLQPRDSAPASTAAPIVATGQSSAEPATPLPPPTPPLAAAMVAVLPSATASGVSQTPMPQLALPPAPPPSAPAQAAPDTPTPLSITQPPPNATPTLMPASTPSPTGVALALPTTTPEPLPTSTPLPQSNLDAYFPAEDPEHAEIIGLRYSGYAGRGDGRFIVVFDEPVFVVRHPGSDPRVELEVRYPSSGNDKLKLQTNTSLDRPSRTLEFGPVAEEFAVAVDVEVNNSEILLGVNGQAAILSVDLGGHPDSIFLDPDYADEVQDPALVRCAALAELDRVSPIVVRSIKSVVVARLTDGERSDWLITLRDEWDRSSWSYKDGSGQRGFRDLYNESRFDALRSHPCSPLWSEEVSPENAHKRNERALKECMNDQAALIRNYGTEYVADLKELLAMPYQDLDVTERAVLRLMLDAPNRPEHSRRGCRRYYPQLYSGAWLPLQDPE